MSTPTYPAAESGCSRPPARPPALARDIVFQPRRAGSGPRRSHQPPRPVCARGSRCGAASRGRGDSQNAPLEGGLQQPRALSSLGAHARLSGLPASPYPRVCGGGAQLARPGQVLGDPTHPIHTDAQSWRLRENSWKHARPRLGRPGMWSRDNRSPLRGDQFKRSPGGASLFLTPPPIRRRPRQPGDSRDSRSPQPSPAFLESLGSPWQDAERRERRVGVVEQGQGGARGPQRLCLLSSPKHWCVTEGPHLSRPVPQRQHQVLAPLQREDCVLSLSVYAWAALGWSR